MDENKNIQVRMPESEDSCIKCDARACGGGCCNDDVGRCNLTSTNWLEDVPDNDYEIVEVLFKNTRRGFYRNSIHIRQFHTCLGQAFPDHPVYPLRMLP